MSDASGDKKVGYDEAARLTGLPKRVLYKRVRSNQIPHYKLSKHSTVFSVRELEVWLASLRAGRLRAQRRDPSVDVNASVKREPERRSSPTAVTPLEPNRERKKPMPPVMNEASFITNAEGQLECSCEDYQWAGSESRRVRSSVPSSIRPSPPVKSVSSPTSAKSRSSWENYFMSIARVVASRSTCPRKSVGAVLVRDNRILTTGFNGSLSGQPHCVDVGCEVVDGHCRRVLHAESNAIMQAAALGIALKGARAYVTASPCVNCFKQLVSVDIRYITYGVAYRDVSVVESLAASVGVKFSACVCDRCGERCGGACTATVLDEAVDKTSTTT